MNYKTISLTVSILVISFAIAFYALGWTEPTIAPPGGNVDLPINVGLTGQVKAGPLGVGGVLRGFSTLVVTGNSITPISPGVCPPGFDWYSSGGGSGDCLVTSLYTMSDGNVGIGTTSPDGELDIVGNQFSVRSRVINENPTGAYAQFTAVQYILPAGTVVATVLASENQPAGLVGTNSNHDFYIRTNNVERMRIDTNGNVGIGTTGPTHKLDIRGPLRIDYNSSDYDVWIQGGSATSGTARNLALLGIKSTDELRLNFGGEYTGGVRIAGPKTIIDGNVGIGTTDPSEKLDVVGNIVASGTICDSTGCISSGEGLSMEIAYATATVSSPYIGFAPYTLDIQSSPPITTSGGLVSLDFAAWLAADHSGTVGDGYYLKIYRDSTEIYSRQSSGTDGVFFEYSSFMVIDNPPAGTYTYHVKLFKNPSGVDTMHAKNRALRVIVK